MTDREAIEYWESFESEIDSLYLETNKAGRAELDKQRPAVKAALVALQEREERSNPTKSWIKYSYDEWICPYCGYDKYCDTLDGGVLPPFCEECGRPLKGADNGS